MQSVVAVVRAANVQRRVRAERGHHAHREGLLLCNFLVVFQRICRVVRCRHKLHMALQHQLARGEVVFFDIRVCAVKNIVRTFRCQRVFNAEKHRKLHVRPHIKRVAHRSLEARRPCAELLARLRVACDERLRHAAGTHQTPLVVVAIKPDLRNIREFPVLQNLLRREVAVVVDDR